ncbi:MAG: DoxX family protein [Thermoanaerobaculia bacterium]
MKEILGRFTAETYAALRIVSGLMFACHGSQKLLGFPAGSTVPLASMPGVAALIELIAGLMIALGLFAGFAAFLASGEMAVAYFIAHFPKGMNPITNKGELAVLYCFIFLYIAAHGSGILSIDRAMRRGAHPNP